MAWVTAIAIIGVAVAVASTAASLYMASENTAAQNKIQDKMAEERDREINENYALAIKSANEQYRSLQRRQQQEGEATAQSEFLASRQGAEARSTARVAAGEAGVSGLSVNNLLGEFVNQESQY